MRQWQWGWTNCYWKKWAMPLWSPVDIEKDSKQRLSGGKPDHVLGCCHVFWTVNFVITNWQTMADLEVGGMPKLDVCGDPTTMGTGWKKWLRALKLYLAAKGVADDKQKTAVMLHSGSMALQNIFYLLVTQSEADKKTFAQSVDILDKHFTPVVNVPMSVIFSGNCNSSQPRLWISF